MVLSEDEKRYLLEKAELYKEAEGDDFPYLKQALECYNRLIAASPPHPYYFGERAEVKYRLCLRGAGADFLSGAIEDIGEAIRLDPDDGENYFLRATYLLEEIALEKRLSDRKRLEAVINEYKSGLSRVPTDFMAWRYLISVAIISGDYDGAVSFYGQCKPYMDGKEDALFRAYLGCLALILAGDDPREEDLSPLYDSSVRIFDFVSCEGYVTSYIGQLCVNKECATRCDKLFEMMGLLIGHYQKGYHRAELLERLKLYQEAIDAYGEAIKQYPGFFPSWYNRGRLFKYLRRYEEALQCTAKAIEINDGFAVAWSNKGDILAALGRNEESLAAYDQALKLDPDFSLARENKKRLKEALYQK